MAMPLTRLSTRSASISPLGRFAIVGVDDFLDERVADDVGAGEMPERDAAHTGQNARGFDQAALLPAGQVDLRDIAGDHRLGAEADPGQEHLHLLHRGVLRLVEDHEALLSVRPRMYARGANSMVVRSNSFAALSNPMRS